MVFSAMIPEKKWLATSDIWIEKKRPTERRPVLDIVAEKVACADGLELREALQQPLALRPFANAGRAK